MTPRTIPQDVKEQVATIIEKFNTEVIKDENYFFVPRYRGRYVYLDRRNGYPKATPTGRIGYTGDMTDWDFAIYKYSSESYDPDEWMFPGQQHLNGSIEGALKACMEAYQ